MELVPDRMRGEIARFDLVDPHGKVIVAKDKRINARHIRDMEAAGMTRVEVSEDYLLGRVLATAVVDAQTGEILASANDELTDEELKKLRAAGVREVRTIYINDLDQGAFISNTVRIDGTWLQMVRPACIDDRNFSTNRMTRLEIDGLARVG